jgi:hypothetical protein
VKLANSPELRRRYGKAARELVVSKLSAKLIGERVVQLYNDMTAAYGTPLV